MEAVAGAVTSLLQKLGELLVGEYVLQKELKGEIYFIQAELESMKGALEKISSTPRDQLDNQDKIWAREVRELSYDIEDSIDIFKVQSQGNELATPQGFKMFVKRCYNLLADFQSRRSTAYEIKDIKRRIVEMSERRQTYMIDTADARPVAVDPRLFPQYMNVANLVGIDKARDELMMILLEEDNEMTKQEDKIVSIVGFGGLGKTTLANVVYRQLKPHCSAFVSVSQNPDRVTLFEDMFYQLAKYSNASVNVVEELRDFLEEKR